MRHTKKDLRQLLDEKAIEISEDAVSFGSIRTRIYEKEKSEMKKGKFSLFNKKKMVVLGVCCMALLSVTVIASSLSKSWVISTNIEYMKLPTIEKVQEDVGFTPKYVEVLPGGYEFQYGGNGTGTIQDEQGNVIGETVGITLSYAKPGEKQFVTLNIDKIPEEHISYEGMELLDTTYKGNSIYFSEQKFKFVPSDYELTEEDVAAQETDALAISYGTDEVTEEQMQFMSWSENGLKYTIVANDFDFTIDEMMEMAKAIIDVR